MIVVCCRNRLTLRLVNGNDPFRTLSDGLITTIGLHYQLLYPHAHPTAWKMGIAEQQPCFSGGDFGGRISRPGALTTLSSYQRLVNY